MRRGARANSLARLTLIPLIQRDLARALRGRRVVMTRSFVMPSLQPIFSLISYQCSSRLWAAILPVVACAIIVPFSISQGISAVGRFLYLALLSFGLWQATMAPRDLATVLFTEERRNGTLGLLYLTGLNSLEIFAAKLSAGFLVAFNRILALLPCLMLPYVMRGITWEGYMATVETLLCWTLLCLSMRVFSSSIFDDESAARLFAEFLLIVVACGGLILNGINKLLAGVPLDPRWLVLWPANAPAELFYNMGRISGGHLHWTNLATLVLSGLFLLVGGIILRNSWQSETFGARRGGLFGRFREWSLARQRKLSRWLWLEEWPYAWLAGRSPDAFVPSWLVLAGVLVLWLIGLWKWGGFWMAPMNFWVTGLVLSVTVKWTLHYSAARQVAEDRGSGSLELLLTSGLTPQEIIEGQERLLKRSARPILYAVAAMFAVFILLGALDRNWNVYAWCTYFLGWVSIACLGPWMNLQGVWTTWWITLNTGRPAFALQKYLWQGGGILSAVVQAILNANKLTKIPYGTEFELLMAGLIAGVLLAFAVAARGSTKKQEHREKILTDMREIAAEPVPDPNDPRLKSWNPSTRLFKDEPEKILV